MPHICNQNAQHVPEVCFFSFFECLILIRMISDSSRNFDFWYVGTELVHCVRCTTGDPQSTSK